LLILSDRIFDSSVDRAIPSLAAAPVGPNIRPWHSRRASSMISFSVAATFSERKGVFPDLRQAAAGIASSHYRKVFGFAHDYRAFDNVLQFTNIPGQGYDWSNCNAFLSTLRIFFPALRA